MVSQDRKPFSNMLAYSCNVKFSLEFIGPNKILQNTSFGPADFGKSASIYIKFGFTFRIDLETSGSITLPSASEEIILNDYNIERKKVVH